MKLLVVRERVHIHNVIISLSINFKVNQVTENEPGVTDGVIEKNNNLILLLT